MSEFEECMDEIFQCIATNKEWRHLVRLDLFESIFDHQQKKITVLESKLSQSLERESKLREGLTCIASKHKPKHDTEEYWLSLTIEECATVLATDTKIARQLLKQIEQEE